MHHQQHLHSNVQEGSPQRLARDPAGEYIQRCWAISSPESGHGKLNRKITPYPALVGAIEVLVTDDIYFVLYYSIFESVNKPGRHISPHPI